MEKSLHFELLQLLYFFESLRQMAAKWVGMHVSLPGRQVFLLPSLSRSIPVFLDQLILGIGSIDLSCLRPVKRVGRVVRLEPRSVLLLVEADRVVI